MIANLAIGAILYYFAGVEIHLFSLAGLTISLGLIMDNTIVMADHLKHRRNFRVFLAILAATLTTISAIVVVFFLPEEVRISLEDFSMIIIINLAVSLFTALFLVPALMDKLGIFDEKKLRLPIKNTCLRSSSILPFAGNGASRTSTVFSRPKCVLSTASGYRQ